MIRRTFATVLLATTAFFSGVGFNASYPVSLTIFGEQSTRLPTVDDEVWCPSLSGITEWHYEVQRRYNDAVIVHCHGNTLGSDWYFFPDKGSPIKVVDGIKKLREKYGARKIVLITCNPGHFRLKFDEVGDVVYSTESIWQMPDKNVNFRSAMDPATPGNVFEFQSTR